VFEKKVLFTAIGGNLMTQINVMLVEDDPVWEDCLSSFREREQDLNVVSCAASKRAAIRAYKENNVDVALVDVMLSPNECDGLDTALELKQLGLSNIIMLTALNDKEIILDAFDKGAVNYITKTSYQDIPRAVREAYSDHPGIHSDASAVLVAELKKERKLKYILTPTEREVYDLREKGMNKAEIAKVLFKSVETVKKQIKQIQIKIRG
jgi:DNA-binding NarL/FixJ family response regulator